MKKDSVRVVCFAEKRRERAERARSAALRAERLQRALEVSKPKPIRALMPGVSPFELREFMKLGLLREVSPGVFEFTHLGRVLIERE